MNIKHIISAGQFKDQKLLEEIFDLTDKIKSKPEIFKNRLGGKIMATLFYEPSTRTRFSFESAMLRLGGEIISTESAGHFSSAVKGETLEDTIRIIGSYVDAIVLRHNQIGAAKRASEVSSVPIINAGDGSGEHPTQALLDIYTIRKELGRMDNLKIALVGDLLYGRTIHSIIQLLSLSKNLEIFLVSPKELKLPDQHCRFLKNSKVKFQEFANLDKIASESDVFYITRIQKERFNSNQEYEKVKNYFVVNSKFLRKIKKSSIIMHPLPRTKEINPEIDSDNRAVYFRQAENGLYVRMALLLTLLG